MRSLDLLLFIVLPYAAVLLALVGTIERYRRHAYSCTSHSTQFLENRLHFWALVPFHAGILLVLAGHLVGFLIPGGVLAWNADPVRLLVLEGGAITAGLLALIGLTLAGIRRLRTAPIRLSTGVFDWIVYSLLLAQIAAGILLSMQYTWGSSWYAAAAAPYLWSIVRLQPDVSLVAPLPFLVQFHIVGAWLLLALFPFSRLVHVLVVPNPYLWRPPQVVRWHTRTPVSEARHP
jgi:nitrate reductase gamma subunit